MKGRDTLEVRTPRGVSYTHTYAEDELSDLSTQNTRMSLTTKIRLD